MHRISGEFADIVLRMTTVSDDMATLEALLTAPSASISPGTTPRHPTEMTTPVAPQATPVAPQPAPPRVGPPPPQYPQPGAYPPPQYPQVPGQYAGGPYPPPPYPPGQFPPPGPVPPAPSPYPPGPRPPAPGVPGPGAPGAPYQPRPRRTLSEQIAAAGERGLIGKLLAAVGVTITLIGVVFMLVLAAQAGLLSPGIRVAGGGVLAAALFGAGVYLGRDTRKRPGAMALVATGVATALFDVLAATAIYHWLPAPVALIAAAVLAAGGLAVAHLWNSQTLGLMVGIPLVVFAPFLTDGPNALLIGFLLTYAAATLWIQVGRDWTAMFAVNTAVATLPLFHVSAFVPDEDRLLFVVAVSINLLLALGSAIILLRTSTRPLILALVSAAAIVPMIGAANVTEGGVATTLLASATVVLAALAFTGGRFPTLTRPVRIVWLSAAAITALAALGSTLTDAGMSIGIATLGLLTAVAAGTTKEMALPLRVIATVLTAIALLSMLLIGAIDQLMPENDLETADHAKLLIVAVIALAAVVLLTWLWGRSLTGQNVGIVGTIGGVIVLWLVTQICVGLAAVITGGTDEGFRGGHAAATILWVLAAAAGLLWARHQRGSARALTLTVSLAIIVAAVAKLFLFDLAALDGVFRVIAFIVVGLLLLALGVPYAQSLDSDESRPPADTRTK
ncbi:hypothetical protein GORHZ_243_00030 [Gordonia rhizosphera NBRC 16068]|uniref:DUF2339 domain-containing protein n=2 Tax=Gordonia rhizosphera TaxID=83341 RepID=K6X4K3_9ACTN|nr:hypothetical protein GORHZ_243_00030 [Gordonia rhizosphera NBRC 16068]